MKPKKLKEYPNMTNEYESSKYGYVPHSYQKKLTCPTCGGSLFKTFPQGVSLSAKIWCYEYVCVNCKQGLGLEVVRDHSVLENSEKS